MMERFGTDLMTMFLATSCPEHENGPREYPSWEDVSQLFFDNAEMIRAAAEKGGRVWSQDAPEQLDIWLMAMSEAGTFDAAHTLPFVVAEELWRRWSFAIAAAMLEHEAGEPLNLPLPREASDPIKGLAVMLYILGGPARAYPIEFVK